MFIKKILSIVELTRPINVIITFAVVAVSAIICSGDMQITKVIILAGLSASLVISAGNVINDIFDIEIDKINRPKRPLPSNVISIRFAKLVYLVFVISAIVISSQISLLAIITVFITSILLFFYSMSLKSKPLIGNITVSICTGLAFVYGGIVVNNIDVAILPAIFAFLINLIREILKDIEDIEGDRRNDQLSLPIVYGIQTSLKVITFLSVVLILFSLLPFVTKIYKIEYFILVLFFVDLPLVLIMKQLLDLPSRNKISRISFALKMIMISGLISIYVGIM